MQACLYSTGLTYNPKDTTNMTTNRTLPMPKAWYTSASGSPEVPTCRFKGPNPLDAMPLTHASNSSRILIRHL